MVRDALVLLAICATTAAADPEPWKQGVTPERMATAQQLLEAGNELLLDRDYTGALVKYQEAIAAWDHPAIRFNIVRCLIHLDRTVEASENLDRALAYGAAPLEELVYSEALAYQKLLVKQVATIVITCKQPGVELSLDGQALAACPGRQERRIVPGRHQVVGKGAGLLTKTHELVVLGGEKKHVDLELSATRTTTRIAHRWSTWVPWSIVGGGVVVAGIGAFVQTVAQSDRQRYFDAVAASCTGVGCEGDFRSDLHDRAVLENRIAVGVISVGLGAVVAGGVMVYLNRGRAVAETAPVTATVTPSAGGAVLGVVGRF